MISDVCKKFKTIAKNCLFLMIKKNVLFQKRKSFDKKKDEKVVKNTERKKIIQNEMNL